MPISQEKFERISIDGKSHQRVSGRRLVIQTIDSLLEEKDSIDTLYDAFHDALHASPIDFYRNVLLPVMPKDTLAVEVDSNQPLTIVFKEVDKITVTPTSTSVDSTGSEVPPGG